MKIIIFGLIRPQPQTKNYRQHGKAESWRNCHSQGGASTLVHPRARRVADDTLCSKEVVFTYQENRTTIKEKD